MKYWNDGDEFWWRPSINAGRILLIYCQKHGHTITSQLYLKVINQLCNCIKEYKKLFRDILLYQNILTKASFHPSDNELFELMRDPAPNDFYLFQMLLWYHINKKLWQ